MRREPQAGVDDVGQNPPVLGVAVVLQVLAQQLDQQMQQREQQLTAPLMERVNAVIEGVRAEQNLSFVFDVAAGNFIVTADRSLDITALVIQRLQAAGPGPAPAPAAAPGTAPADSTRATTPAAPPAGPRLRPRP